MKKLMTMIAAAATAFGLFADVQKTFSTSFEANDVEVMDGFLPTNGWYGAEAELLEFANYAGDAYAYGADAFARRNEYFVQDADQTQYLKLKTGTSEVKRDVGDVFLDQLVKFTGFEDDPVIDGGDIKVALWMKGIEAGEGEPNEGETNLYITAATVNAGEVTPVAFKIPAPAGEAWEVEKWYRLTVKNIGDIYKGENPDDPARAGFIVYIDGQQVSCEEAKGIVEYESEMTPDAVKYMKQGQLFPAIASGDVAFNSVGYKGIGAIDDIIVDTQGPEFAQTIEYTFTVDPSAVEGLAETVSVKDADGNPVAPDEEGKFTVAQGTVVTITYAPAEGFKAMGNLDQTVPISEDDLTIEPDESIEVAQIVAMVTNDESSVDYAEGELYELFMNGLVDGDTVTFKASGVVQDGDENVIYDFTKGTTIGVAIEGEAVTLTINVNQYDDGESGSFYDCVGVKAGDTKIVNIAEDCEFLAGNDDIAITVAGTLKAEVISIVKGLSLVGDGKVYSMDDALEITDDQGNAVEAEDASEEMGEGWYVYAIKEAPTDWTATVDLEVGDGVIAPTKAKIDEEEVEIKDGKITVPSGETAVIEYTLEEGYELDEGDLTQELTEDNPVSVAPTAKQIMVDFTVAEITGAELLAVSNGTEEVVADLEGKYSVPTNATVTLYYAPAEGYRLTKTTAEVTIDTADQQVDVSSEIAPAQIDYVAEVNGTQYETFEEAVAALTEDDQTITLLKNATIKTAVSPAFDVTFDMGGFQLDAPGVEKLVTCATGKTLNLTNGVFLIDGTKSYTFEVNGTVNVLDGATVKSVGASGPVVDVYDGAVINVYDGAKVVSGGQQTFRCKNNGSHHEINIYGGDFSGASYVVDCYKSNSTAQVTISGGTFNGTHLLRVGDGVSTNYVGFAVTVDLTITDGEITTSKNPIDVGVGSKLNCTLDDTCLAKFSNATGLNAFCKAGYKARDNGEGWYTIQAIEYATLAVTADEGITYVLTNKTTEAVVENGYQADIDNAEVIEAVDIVVTAEGYELDQEASTTSVTLDAAETKTIVLKKKATTYTITYTTGNGAVVTNSVTEYTIETDTFNLPVAADIDMSKVEGVEFVGWTNATSEVVVTKVDKGTKGNLEFFAKWAAVAPQPTRPTPIEGGDEDQKKAYDDWKSKTAGDVTGLTDAQIVDRFVMNVPAATTEEQLAALADEELESIADAALKAIMAGQEPDLSALKAKYPNATIKLVQSDKLTSTETAKFYQLKFSFTPANQQDE